VVEVVERFAAGILLMLLKKQGSKMEAMSEHDPTPLRVSTASRVVRGVIVRCVLALLMFTMIALATYFRRFLGLTDAWILCATLFVVAFTGIAVFWPIVRAIRRETEKFTTANARLEQRAAELAATLGELEKERDERRSRMQAMTRMMADLEEERGKLEREIQARQVVQDALEASEQRSFTIIESAPTAMVVTNARGEIVMANARAEELFGYDREDLFGQPIETLVGERTHEPPASGRDGKSHRDGNASSQHANSLIPAGKDFYGVRKDGTEFPIQVGLNPIEMEEGQYVLSAIVDITERKRAEEEIKRINKELQRRNDEMQQFVYTISHDLKSPLVTCKGFMGLMKEDAQAGRWDVVLDSVGRIERAIQRMGDLIEDLLELSRIGVIRNEPEEVDVGQMVQAIADELADRLQQAGGSVRIQDDLPHVMADRVRLAEVFENLLSNAIKYGCRNGSGVIVVGGKQDSQEIQFFVRDDGPGIAKEFHRKVFGLFQRLESNQEGTGVGLAAVARIMETHGGRAWVESTPGHGATFWIAFPATCDAPTRPLDLRMEAPSGAKELAVRG
jgi:PAS domain S-box-containing protein